MTTSPYPSVTDELIAELDMDVRNSTKLGIAILIEPEELADILAERADLIKDRTRLEKLAAHAYLIYGRHDVGMWRFPEMVVNSTREQCTTGHLRAAIDSMEVEDA